MLDKDGIYIGYSRPYKGRNQSPSKNFSRIKILYEDDIGFYVESLVSKDAAGFGKRYSVKKHCFFLRAIRMDRIPKSNICEKCPLHEGILGLLETVESGIVR